LSLVALLSCKNGLTPESIRQGAVGSIQVNSTPTGAAVWLDAVNTGDTTNTLLANVAVGLHTLKLTLSGYQDWQDTLTVNGGEISTRSATLTLMSTWTFLGTNAQGYEEYLHMPDSSAMIRIPAGSFTMGSAQGDSEAWDDEKPQHQVTLSEYYIDKYEVTNRQYKRFCDGTSRSYPPDPGFDSLPNYFLSYPDFPAVDVTWVDATAYCTWAGKQLPTEAEWERAARGTDARKYPWGGSSPDGSRCNIWSNDDGYFYTAPVGHYPNGASPYGCMDMAGNVWEWCNDWYDASYYSSSPTNNPPGPSSGSSRVYRGGSWVNDAGDARSASRPGTDPSSWNDDLGFRCSARR
jgi:formylglycine-generating enzyme required for sulfatase activity